MMHFSGDEAINILYSKLDHEYCNYSHVDYYFRRIAVRNLVNTWKEMNIRIQAEEPHLILWDTTREHEGQTFTKTENAKIGRWLTKQLAEADMVLTDAQIENFVNYVKAEVAINGVTVELVTGEEIRKAYHADNYSYTGIGDLGGSCMRYSECQPFFDVYVENPDTIALAVIRDATGYKARGLVWTDVNGKRWLDRVYANNKNELIMRMWAKSEGIELVHLGHYEARGGITVALDKGDFKYYPFMDSLRFLLRNRETGKYFLASDSAPEGTIIGTLTYTMGGPFNSLTSCQWCEENFVEDGVRYCDSCLEDMSECENCGGMQHYEDMHYLDGSGQDVCNYCHHYHSHECDVCNERYMEGDLESHDHYGRVCSTCTSDMIECEGCAETFAADDLNPDRLCEGCDYTANNETDTVTVAEPAAPVVPAQVTQWKFHWPNPMQVEPCFYIRHTFDPNTGVWTPDPTNEDMYQFTEQGYQWNGGQIARNGIPVMLSGD